MYSFNTRIVEEHKRISWESSFQKLSNAQKSKVHQLICWDDKKKVAWLWADLFKPHKINCDLRPTQITRNCKYVHGNSPTFHRSRHSWVRSHNKTMSKALCTPVATIWIGWSASSLMEVAQLSQAFGSWRFFPDLYFQSTRLLKAYKPFKDNQEVQWCHKQIGAAACKALLETAGITGKMMSWDIVKSC